MNDTYTELYPNLSKWHENWNFKWLSDTTTHWSIESARPN